MASNLVKYGSYSDEAAEAERQELDSESTSDFIKLKVGRNVFRIPPPPPGHKSPFRITHRHYIRVPGEEKPIVFNCPRMATAKSKKNKKSCKACAEANELRSSGNPLDRNKGYELLPKRHVLCNVVIRKSESVGVKVWGFGKGIHDDLLAFREDPDDPCDFTDPMEGYDIIIIRKGTGKTDTEYKVRIAKRASQLHEDVDQMNEWITGQPNLERHAELPSDDDILMMLEGERPDRRQLPPGEGKKGSRRSSSRKKTADDDVVDGEFEDADDFPKDGAY